MQLGLSYLSWDLSWDFELEFQDSFSLYEALRKHPVFRLSQWKEHKKPFFVFAKRDARYSDICSYLINAKYSLPIVFYQDIVHLWSDMGALKNRVVFSCSHSCPPEIRKIYNNYPRWQRQRLGHLNSPLWDGSHQGILLFR